MVRQWWPQVGAGTVSGTSVTVVSGAFVEDEDAGAIGAEGLAVVDVQPDAGMAERAVAAVAGDRAAVDVQGLRLCQAAGWACRRRRAC